MDILPTEPELVHSSGMQVLDEDIGCLEELGQNRLAVGSGRVKSKRLLIGVKLQEIVTGTIRVKLQLVASRVACAWTFDFDYFGPEPCEKLGT